MSRQLRPPRLQAMKNQETNIPLLYLLKSIENFLPIDAIRGVGWCLPDVVMRRGDLQIDPRQRDP
jgi:hypothetical protein